MRTCQHIGTPERQLVCNGIECLCRFSILWCRGAHWRYRYCPGHHLHEGVNVVGHRRDAELRWWCNRQDCTQRIELLLLTSLNFSGIGLPRRKALGQHPQNRSMIEFVAEYCTWSNM